MEPLGINLLWWLALVIAIAIIVTLIVDNPFKKPWGDEHTEERKEIARRRWAQRVNRAAREHYPKDR
jgi:peptidoglycan/LPS O-acetylase OafA/YrhL